MDNEKEISIDLGKLFTMLKKRIVYILLATLILAVTAGCLTEFLIEPKYTTSCTMYVYSNTDRVSTNSSIGSSELTASQQLVNTYIVVLESDYVLENVIKDLNLEMTTSQLKNMISCSQINETEIFRVSVTSTDAALAADVANTIAKIAPDAIVQTIKAGGVSVIDYAKVPSSPSSPNLIKNVIIGALVGFVLSFAIFFITELFDTTIRTDKDLEREFNIPILGDIPRLIPVADKVQTTDSAGILRSNRTAKGGKD